MDDLTFRFFLRLSLHPPSTSANDCAEVSSVDATTAI